MLSMTVSEMYRSNYVALIFFQGFKPFFLMCSRKTPETELEKSGKSGCLGGV